MTVSLEAPENTFCSFKWHDSKIQQQLHQRHTQQSEQAFLLRSCNAGAAHTHLATMLMSLDVTTSRKGSFRTAARMPRTTVVKR
jgi:hypothetical protein